MKIMAKKIEDISSSDFSTPVVEGKNKKRKDRRRRKSRDDVQRVSAYLTAEEYDMLDELANDYDETLTKTISRAVKFLYSKRKNNVNLK